MASDQRVPNLVPPGTRMRVTLREMMEPWVNHVVYVRIAGTNRTVPAKILSVDENDVEIIVLSEDQAKASR